MIYDGYTVHATHWGRKYSYRPALYAERVEVLRGHRTMEHVTEFLKRHIVWQAEPTWWDDDELEEAFLICLGVKGPESGWEWTPTWELDDARNLRDGVVLERKFPLIAKRSCEACQKWWFNEDTGRIVQRGGKPLLRQPDALTLCQTHEGCPKGTPDNPIGLNEKNKAAWRHFQECAAVGQFPDDPIVRRNARIIRRALSGDKKRGR